MEAQTIRKTSNQPGDDNGKIKPEAGESSKSVFLPKLPAELRCIIYEFHARPNLVRLPSDRLLLWTVGMCMPSGITLVNRPTREETLHVLARMTKLAPRPQAIAIFPVCRWWMDLVCLTRRALSNKIKESEGLPVPEQDEDELTLNSISWVLTMFMDRENVMRYLCRPLTEVEKLQVMTFVGQTVRRMLEHDTQTVELRVLIGAADYVVKDHISLLRDLSLYSLRSRTFDDPLDAPLQKVTIVFSQEVGIKIREDFICELRDSPDVSFDDITSDDMDILSSYTTSPEPAS